METVILICCIVIIIMLVFLISVISGLAKKNSSHGNTDELNEIKKQIEFLGKNNTNHNKVLLDQSVRQSETVVRQISVLGDSLRNSINIQQEKTEYTIDRKLTELESDFDKARKEINIILENIRRDNTESLDRINNNVNEKLQKSLDDRISKSFEAVNRRLAEVYEGLGEMKNVASGVSDLKNILSNVKTRGIMGEIQLGAILSEILSPEQYEEQISVIPRSSEKVDFAVKFPGTDNSNFVYLPIDSKFPADTYSKLLSAYESGNPDELKAKRNLLTSEIKRCARSIHEKYIKPPYTTDFAVMFLPFEGLYSEVINLGLIETLQREYKINIAGPSTMAAMLNSLQMGFRTLAIQKKSSEVWKILEGTKKEFENFEKGLDDTRNRLRQADEELEKLIGTRTNAINRKLKNITVTDSD